MVIMETEKSNALNSLGNENSYTEEFFENIFKDISIDDPKKKSKLKHSIISAAGTYLRYLEYYKKELPPHEISKELKKTIIYTEKAKASLNKIYESGNYNRELIECLCCIISEKFPSLDGLSKDMRIESNFVSTIRPEKSLSLLTVIQEGIKRAQDNYKMRGATTKSKALNRWLVVLSYELESIIGRSLEQSHYHKGKNKKEGVYIPKRKVGDSEFLHFILKHIDPDLTISQIETALKDTRKERKDQQRVRVRNYLSIQWILAT